MTMAAWVAMMLAVSSRASGLSNYGAFGKWTHTASSPEAAYASQEFTRLYLNTRPVVRNKSKTDYLLVGPTGCEGVVRTWTAQRFLIGDNQYHWVHDATRPSGLAGSGPARNVSVSWFHEYLVELHGDLSGPRSDWSDFSFGSYAESVDELLGKLDAGNVSARLVRGWDDTGLAVYSIFVLTPDGYVYETLGPSTASPERFTEDACHFRPTERFRAYNLSDRSFEAYSASKLGSYMTAGPARDEAARETTPHHTSIPSPDPERDAKFLTWLLEGRVLNSSSADELDRCSRKVEKWVHFGAAGGIGKSNDHYIRLVRDDAALQVAAEAYERSHADGYYSSRDHAAYLASTRRALGSNVYDAFLDDHLGFDFASGELAKIIGKLVEADVPFLTRREPNPSSPDSYACCQWEKFSIFVLLPISKFALQLQSCCVEESFFEAPFQFCDWDFCPSFGNYRNASVPLLNDATSCGYSAIAFGGSRNVSNQGDEDEDDAGALDGAPTAPFGGLLSLASIVASARPSGIVMAKSLKKVLVAIGAFLGFLIISTKRKLPQANVLVVEDGDHAHLLGEQTTLARSHACAPTLNHLGGNKD